MNRRDFLLDTLKTAGATAFLVELNRAKLLALPDDVRGAEGEWFFDGTPRCFLQRVVVLLRDDLKKRGLGLNHVGQPDGYSLAHHGWTMINACFRLDLIPAKLREGRALRPGEPVACYGQQAQFVPYDIDPVKSVQGIATDIGNCIEHAKLNAWSDLELPHGVPVAIAMGPLRLVTQYDIHVNEELMRIDFLGAKL